MACSCRATPWTLFAQGLAQLHMVERRPWRGLNLGTRPPLSSLFRPTSHRRLAFLGFHPKRSLHISTTALQDPSPGDDEASIDRQSTAAEGGSSPAAGRISPRTNEATQTRPEVVESPPAKRRANGSTCRASGRGDDVSTKGQEGGPKPEKKSWRVQKEALQKKFPEGWQPRKRLSPDALAGIRALNAQFPDVYTTEALAGKFEVSPEAIRRILRSKWQPSAEEEDARQERWLRRGKRVWEYKAALGLKPPRRWRREGVVRDVAYHRRVETASRLEREREEAEAKQYLAYRAGLKQGDGGSSSNSSSSR